MCISVPGLVALGIETPGMNFDLTPASGLSSLVQACLENSFDTNLEADLKSLPASVETLYFNGFHLRNVDFECLRCVRIKVLDCWITHETFDDTCRPCLY